MDNLSKIILIDFQTKCFTHLKFLIEAPFPPLEQGIHNLEMMEPPNGKLFLNTFSMGCCSLSKKKEA